MGRGRHSQERDRTVIAPAAAGNTLECAGAHVHVGENACADQAREPQVFSAGTAAGEGARAAAAGMSRPPALKYGTGDAPDDSKVTKGPRTPSVRNDLVNSLQGRTPQKMQRYRRTSTIIEEMMSGGHVNDAFAVSQVNTWHLMRGIIRASASYIFTTLFVIGLSFGLDLALHYTVFEDTPCGLRANCDLDNDGLAADGTENVTAQVTWMGLTLESWQGVGSFMPEVVFAVVGIALSIVSLILQLSATRYSPFVVDLFFRDSVSSFVMNYFVGTAIYCLWINCLLGNSELNFMPRISVIVMMVGMTTSSLMIIPFFQYVFAFIQPKTQVDIMVSEALEAALTQEPQSSSQMLVRQTKVLDSVQRLSEYALSAVNQKDAAIAFHCVSNMVRHCTRNFLTDDARMSWRAAARAPN